MDYIPRGSSWLLDFMDPCRQLAGSAQLTRCWHSSAGYLHSHVVLLSSRSVRLEIEWIVL
jgi:hypothetical protein